MSRDDEGPAFPVTMTPVQRDIVRFIKEYRDRNTISPTYQEIADHRGTCISTISEHIDSLCNKGIVERDRWSPRSLRVVGTESKLRSVEMKINWIRSLSDNLPANTELHRRLNMTEEEMDELGDLPQEPEAEPTEGKCTCDPGVHPSMGEPGEPSWEDPDCPEHGKEIRQRYGFLPEGPCHAPTEPTDALEELEEGKGITRNENIWGGVATVAGSRVPVFMVVDLEAEGETVFDILRRYPHLTPGSVSTALSYARENGGLVATEVLSPKTVLGINKL